MQPAIVPIAPALRLKKVLMATDFSYASGTLLSLVAALAHRFDSEVIVAHVAADFGTPPEQTMFSVAEIERHGGGAFDDKTFGYAGRASNGHTGLANVIDFSAAYKLSKQWSAAAYVSYANGGPVMSEIYGTRSSAGFGYLELNWTLPQH